MPLARAPGWRRKALNRWRRSNARCLKLGLREATNLARGYQPLGKIQDNLAVQTEFARKVFEIAVKGAQESATTARQSTGEAAKIIQDRLKESFEELRGSISRGKST